jgi:dolichol-phosphate mannosyltransferase
MFVLVEWFVYNVPHQVIAIGSAGAVLFGVQLLMFGVLSDLILTLHREQLGRIDELEARRGGDDDA